MGTPPYDPRCTEIEYVYGYGDQGKGEAKRIVCGYGNGYDGENSDFPTYIAKRSTYPYSYTDFWGQGEAGRSCMFTRTSAGT